MASNYQLKQLSTPAVYVNGELVAVLPNSVTVHVPGEAQMRAMSAGGSAIEVVYGIDASKFIGHVKMDIPNTAQNADRVRLWKQNLKDGIPMTVLVAEDEAQFPHQQMFLSKSTDLHFKSDGAISLEFEGQYVA